MATKIAYLVSRFPSQYQTFVAREIYAMKRRGYDIMIFSLKRPGKIWHQDAKPLQNDIYYRKYFMSLCIWSSNIRLVISKPNLYVKFILYIIIKNIHDPMSLFKAFAVFPKTVHYAEVMKLSGVSHIHAHWATVPALCAILCSRIIKAKYSMTCHAFDIFGVTTMLKEKIERAKFVVTCTEHNKKHLLQTYQGIERDKIYVNYHGLDLEKFKQKTHRRKNNIKIVSVGRIEPSKGFEYLIEACAKLKKKKKHPFHCSIIGDGPKKNKLCRLIDLLKLSENVTLVGALTYEEVIEYYEKSSIFVLAAVSEHHRGIPNVIVEAMAMELPVIVTPLPAISELIINGENGVIIPEKNPRALSDAIANLIDSDELREHLGREGRLTVERLFDMNKTYQELNQIFEKYL